MRISDWSSDVCSSDLGRLEATRDRPAPPASALMPDPRRPCAISQQSSPRLRSGGRARLRGVMSMAQFQILCPHSEAEWRPITIEFIFAPNGDQQYLWPSFEEAEAARKQLLLRAPDVQLRIALAGADIGDVDLPVREKLPLAAGSYAPPPWPDDPRSRETHADHSCHV